MKPLSENEAKLFAEKIIGDSVCRDCPDLLIKIHEELVKKYKMYSRELDSKFLDDVLKGEKTQVTSRLWEFVVLDRLRRAVGVNIYPHTNDGPDWKVRLNNNCEYYVEATCAHPPTNSNSEINRVTREFSNGNMSSSDEKLSVEAKSRISAVVDRKLKEHQDFMISKDAGYILAVSYGGLPFYANCDLYNAVQTVCPIGDYQLTVNIDPLSGEPVVGSKGFGYQEDYKKPTSDALIPCNIFGSEEYSWVSAVLFSGVNPGFLLESADELPNIVWNGIKNDFVLVHNSAAKKPLLMDIFESNTEVIFKPDKIIVKGENIFPFI